MTPPLVSVVTPFHNTAEYLGQCVESVLAQSYANFEYILVDNCSTDGAGDIAEAYAQQDSRIRVIHRSELLPQVRNYNCALAEISPVSKFCKIVQADDCIFPECLELMVRAFEKSESIGLVSSYWLKGDRIWGFDFPFPTPQIDGKQVARMYLRRGIYVFGSPSTVMFRSSIVRQTPGFYSESLLHEDTEKCMSILSDWDFGFVHQVLSYLRINNDSISSRSSGFQPDVLDRYILIQRFAEAFLGSHEAQDLIAKSKRDYYRVLARGALGFQGSDFWRYHRTGLKTIGQDLDLPLLTLTILGVLLWRLANPGLTFVLILRFLRSLFAQDLKTKESNSESSDVVTPGNI